MARALLRLALHGFFETLAKLRGAERPPHPDQAGVRAYGVVESERDTERLKDAVVQKFADKHLDIPPPRAITERQRQAEDGQHRGQELCCQDTPALPE